MNGSNNSNIPASNALQISSKVVVDIVDTTFMLFYTAEFPLKFTGPTNVYNTSIIEAENIHSGSGKPVYSEQKQIYQSRFLGIEPTAGKYVPQK